MGPVFILTMLLAPSLAAPPPPTPLRHHYEIKAFCFDPPDFHPVSRVVNTCKALFTQFTEAYEPRGNLLRWTGDSSETGDDVVHLPITESRINPNRTQACLLEIRTENQYGDIYPPTNIPPLGRQILEECFRHDKCGEIALPPHFTTSLTVCGSYHQNGTISNKVMQSLEMGASSVPPNAMIPQRTQDLGAHIVVRS
ncbi:hypothetical protein N7G274_001882 [Stereocaulon virgatum]|uniref:Uncharacterized protein n=1 Tax=Stereocaulon virgatum TaxID=373712 RepID=A0ABR4ALR5_9LECA